MFYFFYEILQVLKVEAKVGLGLLVWLLWGGISGLACADTEWLLAVLSIGSLGAFLLVGGMRLFRVLDFVASELKQSVQVQVLISRIFIKSGDSANLRETEIRR